MARIQALVLLTLICISGTAGAERWQVRVDNDRIRTRLDLNSIERDGHLLTYRVEMTRKQPPNYVGRRDISTSVIDCRTNMRKHVATETHFPDGTVRKSVGAHRWMKLKEIDFGTGVRNDYCGKVSVIAPVDAKPATEITHAAASSMTTQELARLFFPNRPSGTFVSHEVPRPGVHGEGLMKINFFHPSSPVSADLCTRDVTVALFEHDRPPTGRDSPVKFTRADSKVQMAIAPRCRLSSGGYFGWVQPKDVAELVPEALRRLARLQAAARAGGPLPEVKCLSDDPTVCAQPSQALLANLTLDRIYSIEPARFGWRFAIMPNGLGQLYWDVRIPPEDAPDDPITMRWGMPAPF